MLGLSEERKHNQLSIAALPLDFLVYTIINFLMIKPTEMTCRRDSLDRI